MTSIKLICLTVLSIAVITQARGQSNEDPTIYFRTEFGFGLGAVKSDFGATYRLGMDVIKAKWGATFRHFGQQGAEGVSGSSSFFGPPIEEHYDVALMLTRELAQANNVRAIGCLGLATNWGELLSEGRQSLEDYKSEFGLAYELRLSSFSKTVGLGGGLIGHVNKERVITAFIISLTFGNKRQVQDEL